MIEDASLFLDLDGTLLDLMDRPHEVRADARLREILAALEISLKGRLAIVSGRSLEQIDAILGDVAEGLAVSGSHGCEHRWRGVYTHPDRPEALDLAAERMRLFVGDRPGIIVEEKSFGVALHYRMNPEFEGAATALAEELATEFNLHFQRGKMVVELRFGGSDKGAAVQHMMKRPPMQGARPIFVGDDVTDEPAFTMSRALGGHGVLVGAPRSTAADYAIPSPAALRDWLAEAAQ